MSRQEPPPNKYVTYLKPDEIGPGTDVSKQFFKQVKQSLLKQFKD